MKWIQILLAIVTLCSISAHADTDDTTNDIRCVVVAAKLGESSDPAQKQAGYLVFLYYLGRIDGRSPKMDMEKAITDELLRMSSADLSAAASRCAATLTARGEKMKAIGQHLDELSQKATDQPVREPN